MRTALVLAIPALGLLAAIAAQPASEPAGKPLKTPTYASDIAAILNTNCVSCHRPGEVAPFSLIGYENAKKWSPMIAAVTNARRMPPWKAKEGYGEFLDEHRLTKAEIETLAAWDAADSPRGDAEKEPATPVFKSEWPFGEPDLILQASKPFQIAAEGDDVYRNFVMKTEFKEPTWVRAMAIKPGNPKIVHHVITFVDGGNASKRLEAKNNDGQEGYSTFGGVGFAPSGSLGGWAPGLSPRETPKGSAFLVKPGSTLVVQVHYHKSGKAEEDLTRVGLYLAKEPVKKEMQLDWIFNFGIEIPPGDKAYTARREKTIPADVTLYGAMPHMHLLGKSMKADIVLPDGTVKPLVWVEDWDFNWQMHYSLKQPIKVPKGSKIRVETIYDNSADNPRNPNSPPKVVRWGEQTTDEMFLLIIAYTVD